MTTRQLRKGLEEAKYNCDVCDYKAPRKDKLLNHVQSVHNVVKYDCDVCDYHATTKSYLQLHVKSVHDELKYNCEVCDHM